MAHKSLRIRHSSNFTISNSSTFLLSHFAPTTMVFLQFLKCTKLIPASEFVSLHTLSPGPLLFPRYSQGSLPYFNSLRSELAWHLHGQDPHVGHSYNHPMFHSCYPYSFMFILTAILFSIACISIRNQY